VAGAEGEAFAVARVARGPLALFDDPAHADLAGLRVRRHYLTETLEGRDEEVLLRFADGSAALALSPAGRGAAAYANFSLAPDGGNLVGSPLFPALLHELLRALRRGEERRAATPGEPWHIDAPAPARGAETNFEVVGPDERPVAATVVARGRSVRLALPPAGALGHYRARHQGAVAAVGVVNVDPRESDTRALPKETLVDPAAGGAGALAVLTEEGKLLHAGRPRDLWPWLAGLAAAFLAGEMLLLALWRRAARTAVYRRALGAES